MTDDRQPGRGGAAGPRRPPRPGARSADAPRRAPLRPPRPPRPSAGAPADTHQEESSPARTRSGRGAAPRSTRRPRPAAAAQEQTGEPVPVRAPTIPAAPISGVTFRDSGSVAAVVPDDGADDAGDAWTGPAADRGTDPRARERAPVPQSPARDTGRRSRSAETAAAPGPVAEPEATVDPATVLPPPPSPRTAFRQRYGVVYNTQGPRIRLALLWAAAVIAVLALRPLRPYGLAVLYGVAAGAAALQVVDAWHEVRTGADRWVAALGASALPVLATASARMVGIGLLVTVVAAVVAASRSTDHDIPLFAAAGHTVLAGGVCGGAAASLVLLADYEIAAVLILITYVMVYDACDYVVGSGARNGVEGPLAGGLFIGAVSALLAVTEVPPFRGVDIWSFAMLAALACPAGQLLASAMLPRADAHAPALRRIDSLLLVAPAWAGLIGLYLQQN